jgi:hypothetical protein
MGYQNFVSKFVANPQWGLMFALGRFRPVSSLILFLHRPHEIPSPPDTPSRFSAIDMPSAVADMRRDGLHTNLNLDALTVAQIVDYASSTPCYWREDRSVQFLQRDRADVERRIGKSILLGRYFDIEERCETIRAISHDPILRHLATLYLGAEPGQIEARLWWSFATTGTSQERLKADQGFHYDLHDYRCIAFFFHLTPVDEFSGPHVYVKGSHRRKPVRMLLGASRQCSDEEMVRQYGAENVVALCGPPGFGFASDPFGYHKGAPPLRDDRLMLRIRYTIHDDGSRSDRSPRTN